MTLLDRCAVYLENSSYKNQLIWAFLAGLLSVLALPPVHWVAVLFITYPVLYILSVAQENWKRALATGFSFGLGYHLAGLYWVSFSVLVEGELLWMLPITSFGLAGLMALYSGIATTIFYLVKGRSCLPVFTFSVCLMFGEFLRGIVFGGFPWNLVGYSVSDSLILIQVASFVGSYGLSFLITYLALFILMGPYQRVTMVLVLVCVIVFGWQRLQTQTSYTETTVRLVQPDTPQLDKVKLRNVNNHFWKQLELSSLKGVEVPDLIIWPETAVLYWLEHEPDLQNMIGSILQTGQTAIVGARRALFKDAKVSKIWNSLFVLNDRGEITDSYDKARLVPFGEFIPLHDYLPLEQITRGRGYTAGNGVRTMTAAGVSFSPLICYEVIFPGAVTDPADRPNFLLNITNDAWYGNSSGPYQHFEMSRLRAIEEGLPMLRAANSGISGIIDPYGRIKAHLDLGQQGLVDGRLPRGLLHATVYQKFPHALLVFLLFGFIISIVRKNLNTRP